MRVSICEKDNTKHTGQELLYYSTGDLIIVYGQVTEKKSGDGSDEVKEAPSQNCNDTVCIKCVGSQYFPDGEYVQHK